MLSFYDWLLVICVALFGTLSSFVRDPQIKAVYATVPLPFGLAWLAVGLPVAATNGMGAFLVLLYVHIVRICHDRFRVPIVAAIGFGITVYAGLGAFLVPRLPKQEWFFVFLCVLVMITGSILLRTHTYAQGVQHRTPLHPLPKFLAVFGVVFALALLKRTLQGFTPFFPMMNSVVSYEARHSLWTQCRQIPVFMVAAGPMLLVMRYTELAGLNRFVVLSLGVVLYMLIFLPVNQWVRTQIGKPVLESKHS